MSFVKYNSPREEPSHAELPVEQRCQPGSAESGRDNMAETTESLEKKTLRD